MRKHNIYFRLIALLLLTITLIGQVSSNKTNAAAETSSGPIITSTYTVMNQVATIELTIDSAYEIKKLTYLPGEVSSVSSTDWSNKGTDITGKTSFQVESSGTYSILAVDNEGNTCISFVDVDLEFRAVWISYLEFSGTGYSSEKKFTDHINTMFDNVVDMNMNAVVVQVHPFGDAMYKSKYFPWSKYVSGKQGKDPGFDPLAIMVEAAHERGLKIHAWLNPYRVTTNSTDVKALATNNPARKWLTDSSKTNDRNVITFNGNMYYNPASKEVQGLIVKGVKEIVQNYDVDGIHFDDYFYPAFGSSYKKVFDATEYNQYSAACKEDGETPLSIADWRRNNVNTLVKNVHTVINKVDSSVEFGISPSGYYDKLMEDDKYYVDIETWLSSDDYVDYICPQLYWSFFHETYPFLEALDAWLELRTSSTVKVYVGIPVYKAGSNLEPEFKSNPYILKEMVENAKDTTKVDGYIFYRYAFFYDSVTKKAVKNLLNYFQ